MDRLKPRFSAAARAAAIAARKKKEAEKKTTKGKPGIFAVRLGNGFTWELRQFGGLTLARGTERYSSSDDALAAGDQTQSNIILPSG